MAPCQPSPAGHTSGDRTSNLGVCPDRESNATFCAQDSIQPTESHRLGSTPSILSDSLSYAYSILFSPFSKHKKAKQKHPVPLKKYINKLQNDWECVEITK